MRSFPKVSCLCPTFARTALLEEAIESFLRQDYEGEAELIVCNDFPAQTLRFEHPRVKMVNLPERARNLGVKRNATAQHATGVYLLTWGDDDVHLPSRISRMVNFAMKHEVTFALEGSHFCLYGGKMAKNTHSTAGAHVIEKNLYYHLGQIPEMSLGEDVAFNNKVLSHQKGVYKACDDPPQFIYRWSSGRPHISAFGAKETDPYGRMLRLAEEAVNTGKEPAGEIELKPQWRQDWEAMTKDL